MAEVIDLQGRKGKERRIAEGRARRRAEAVASSLSCGMCPRRCAHCGQPAEFVAPPPMDAPYPFCEVCQEEYEAFRRLEKGVNPRPFGTPPVGHHLAHLAGPHAGQSGIPGSPAFLKLMEEHLD